MRKFNATTGVTLLTESQQILFAHVEGQHVHHPPRNMSTEAVLFGLLSIVGTFLASWLRQHAAWLPQELCAMIIFILFAALVSILLVRDARASWDRCVCALILCSFAAVVLLGLVDNPHTLRAALFGSTMTSDMERDVTMVLGDAGLSHAAALLRSHGVFNLGALKLKE